MCIRGSHRVFQTNLVGSVQSVEPRLVRLPDESSRITTQISMHILYILVNTILQNSEFFTIEHVYTYK